MSSRSKTSRGPRCNSACVRCGRHPRNSNPSAATATSRKKRHAPFAGTAERLRAAGAAPEQVSRFLTQCVFSFFAKDVGLPPVRLFERLVGVTIAAESMRTQLGKLFEAMRDGGLFGVDAVPWFNGSLFARIDVPLLADADVAALKAASALNWSAIAPSIFGTLFERGLNLRAMRPWATRRRRIACD